MTHKLIILFKQPENPAEFERRWSEEFVPLAERLPGLKRVVVATRRAARPGRWSIYLVHELHFARPRGAEGGHALAGRRGGGPVPGAHRPRAARHAAVCRAHGRCAQAGGAARGAARWMRLTWQPFCAPTAWRARWWR